MVFEVAQQVEGLASNSENVDVIKTIYFRHKYKL